MVSISASAELEIARPIEEVWAYVSDVRHQDAWVDGMSESELMGGGEVRRGSEIRGGVHVWRGQRAGGDDGDGVSGAAAPGVRGVGRSVSVSRGAGVGSAGQLGDVCAQHDDGGQRSRVYDVDVSVAAVRGSSDDGEAVAQGVGSAEGDFGGWGSKGEVGGYLQRFSIVSGRRSSMPVTSAPLTCTGRSGLPNTCPSSQRQQYG